MKLNTEIKENKMENKYYIPKIEEIYSGFEYEYFNGKNWIKSNEFSNDFDYDDNPHYALMKKIEIKEARVKYLDEEDIEELEWKKDKKYDHDKKQKLFFRPSNVEWYESMGLIWVCMTNHVLIFGVSVLNEDDKTLFAGTIKNKSELKVLMKQLGI